MAKEAEAEDGEYHGPEGRTATARGVLLVGSRVKDGASQLEGLAQDDVRAIIICARSTVNHDEYVKVLGP